MRIVFATIVGLLCAFTADLVLPVGTHHLIALYLSVIAGGWTGGFLARKRGWLIGLLVGCLNLALGIVGLVYLVVVPNGLPLTVGIVDPVALPTILVCSVAGYAGERCYRWCPVQLHWWPPHLSVGSPTREAKVRRTKSRGRPPQPDS